MEDPLSRALSESAPHAQLVSFDARPLGETLETLRGQILAVLNEHFFDAGVVDADIPLLHHSLIESGSIRIFAKRTEPAYEASISVDARCVRADAGDAPHYEIEATGVLRRLRSVHSGEHLFRIAIVPGADGTRSVDNLALTRELAEAISRFAEEDRPG
jgi:hypothetical protein